MTEKEKKPAEPPRPIVSRSSDYKTIYVTGAIGNFSPFDYRLTFYTHEEQWPEKPKQVSSVPISQVMCVTLVMTPTLMKNLRDLLDRQLKNREKSLKKGKEKEKIA